MSLSPRKKKIKFENTCDKKRGNDSDQNDSNKRMKSAEVQSKDLIILMKRKNFVSACEIVSFQAFHDYRQRFQLICLPSCVANNCKHNNNNRAIPETVVGLFKIDMTSHAWCEALDVCNITRPGQYLSESVLMDVVEIMMNAHEDEYSSYTVDDILHRCQQILSHNFTAYPPCNDESLRKCYKHFLTSPMADKDNTFSNRTDYGHTKGIFEYCIRRLEYELNINSKDGPLVEINENIPEQIKQSVKGLHFKNEKLEIFETLHRLDRIKRIITVLESINQLLQHDLAIWHSRYLKHDVRRNKIRAIKPLMAIILWSDNDLKTGCVTNTCTQMMKLFIYFVHLQYPDEYIRTLVTLLNTTIQTFYIYESSSTGDYPTIQANCNAFAKKFNSILFEMPHHTVIKVLEKIQPFYMQYKLATLYLNAVLKNNEEDDVIRFFIYFVDKTSWRVFPSRNKIARVPQKPIFYSKKVKSFTNILIKQCSTVQEASYKMQEEKCRKFDPNIIQNEEPLYQDQVIYAFYIALRAYLDAYSILQMQETLDTLNNKLLDGDMDMETSKIEMCHYTVTEHFVKKYRSIYQMLNKLILKLTELQNNGNLPNTFKIFESIGLLEFKIDDKEENQSSVQMCH